MIKTYTHKLNKTYTQKMRQKENNANDYKRYIHKRKGYTATVLLLVSE